MAAGGDNLHLHTPESEGGEAPTVSVLSADFSKLQVNEELTTPKSVLRSKRSRDVTKRVLFPSQDVTLSPKQPLSAQNPGAVSTRAAFPSWTEREELALIRFMLLYTEGTSWSSRSGKGDRFWEKAGGYIQKCVKSSYCRTGIYYIHIVAVSESDSFL